MKSRYKKLKRSGKTLSAHREIMAEHLGRQLDSDEHVHHKNHDRYDNRVDNLEVKPAAEHAKQHADEWLKYPREKVCEVCGKTFTPHRTKRKRAKTCSWECRNILIARTERLTKSKAAEALVRANVVDDRIQEQAA